MIGLIALVPYVANYSLFREFYWYQDDWWLLEKLDQKGLFRWLFDPFNGTVAPLFRGIWFAVLKLGEGSYQAMLAFAWIIHAINMALFYLLLRRVGFGRELSGSASLIAALSWIHIETMMWSTALSNLLCALFFLVAVTSNETIGRPLKITLIALCASILSYSRGIVGLGMLGIRCGFDPKYGGIQALKYLFLPLLLAIFVVLIGLDSSQPSWVHSQPAWSVAGAIHFGWNYWAGNPLLRMMAIVPEDAAWKINICGIFKGLVLIVALLNLRREKSSAFFFVLACIGADFADAALVALARSDSGVKFANSSRYQYYALLFFAPILCIAVSSSCRAIFHSRFLAKVAQSLLVAMTLIWVYKPWSVALTYFGNIRGKQVKLALDSSDPTAQTPGLPVVSLASARKLREKFKLH